MIRRPRGRYMPPPKLEECPKPTYPERPRHPAYPMYPSMGTCPIMNNPMMMRCMMMCMSNWGYDMAGEEGDCMYPMYPIYPMMPMDSMYPIMPMMDEEMYMSE